MVTLQIGNSDDKLTQNQWSEFCAAVGMAIRVHGGLVHFCGTSDGMAPWQNAAFVFECSDEQSKILQPNIAELRKIFRQDSAAWTSGEIRLI